MLVPHNAFGAAPVVSPLPIMMPLDENGPEVTRL